MLSDREMDPLPSPRLTRIVLRKNIVQLCIHVHSFACAVEVLSLTFTHFHFNPIPTELVSGAAFNNS